MDLGAPELIIILVVVLLVFGGSRIPALARSLGKAQNEFKNAVAGNDEPTVTKPAATTAAPASAAEAAPAATVAADAATQTEARTHSIV